jgi:peptidoglycan/LPS O-acetylase OafA/YrhL
VLAAHQGQALERVVRWTARAAGLGAIPPRHVAVVLSAYAAFLHNWVLPEHYREWWGYGLYFLVATTAQAFCAGLLLFWPRRWIFRIGILGNSAILVLYAVTRTLGIPFFGPAAGLLEPVGALDLVTAATELCLVLVLVQLDRQAQPARPAARPPHTIP